jgi:outer membrane protein insertion porin family
VKFIRFFLIQFFVITIFTNAFCQTENLPNAPQSYELGGYTISGTKYLDQDILKTYTGLVVGQKVTIPGEEIGKAINALWKQGLFANIGVEITNISGSTIFLNIALTERPRLGKWTYRGIGKGDAEDLNKKIQLIKGKVFTENLKTNSIQSIKDYYFEKGYTAVEVKCFESVDSIMRNTTNLLYLIIKGKKLKIEDIYFVGNDNVAPSKLKRLMKDTKERARIRPLTKNDIIALQHFSFKKFTSGLNHLTLPVLRDEMWNRFRLNIFSASKYRREDFEGDKQKIVDYYNSKGFRDAEIIGDTSYKNAKGNLVLTIKLNEGKKYYFRNFYWKGNTKYSDKELSSVLGIKRGDIYDKNELDSRLNMNQNSTDVSSLYMDDGYLFFQITPNEIAVDKDSIDMEIRIYEGKQATINKIIIKGNEKTNENVIRREIRTIPGQKFSRSDIVRSNREIATLGFFNQEKIGITPIPHPEDGTVDIEYNLEEKSTDQIELQAGYGGAYTGLIGTLGFNFTNFSSRNLFKAKSWNPIPSGDAQKLGLRVQSTGKIYQSGSLSFTEPWLGGKRPNSLSVALYATNYNTTVSNVAGNQLTVGISTSIGKRLKFPDDYFTYIKGINIERYFLKNQNTAFIPISTGTANNFNFEQTISRSSINQPLYPQSGSRVSLSLKVTPPYSLLSNKDYSTLSDTKKYEFVEYHRWRFTSEWFTPLDKSKKFVLRTAAKFGFLGSYSSQAGSSPFERFSVGGDGITGYRQYGLEIIALRGYDIFTPSRNAALFNKFTMELRYPISLNPSSTIYAQAFIEGANAWTSFKNYDPFKLNRSAGLGLRVFLPMFGLLGVDYGIRFDNIYNESGVLSQRSILSKGSKFADAGKFNIILGFEPE